MSKVSVLIAAYNAGKYISECLDSLSSQTFADFEAIVVDDASSDNTSRIIEEYIKKDGRISLIRSDQNEGQAKSQNKALRKACGEYVCMLDADDWMSPDALQKAYESFMISPDTDCVLFQVCEVDGEMRRNYPLPEFSTLSGEDAFVKSLTWEIHGLYMIRASIHQRFPYDDCCKSYSEDNTTRIHFLNSRVIRQCEGVYYYRQHPDSMTHHVSVKRFDFLVANESMRKQLIDAHVDDRLLAVYEKERWLNLIGMYCFYYVHRRKFDTKDREYALKELRRVWSGIDVACLPQRLKWKFGYMPMCFCWTLFRMQEETYFFLRSLVGRNHN